MTLNQKENNPSTSTGHDLSAHARINWSNLTDHNVLAENKGVLAENIRFCQTNDTTAVVLGYYNGNKYLREQLRSILDQSHTNLDVFIADDCSSEKLMIDALDLSQIEKKRVYFGTQLENRGFAKNFLSALCNINNAYCYFAFSDQDDIWFPDKVENALKILKQYPENTPVLYCARTIITDENGSDEIGISPDFIKPAGFANALVQSIGCGCTMVLNRAARDLVVNASHNVNPVSHDWWCYQIVSGAGGVVYFDKKPCMRYRQHSTNLVGLDNGWYARIVRLLKMFDGMVRTQNNINIAELSKQKHLLTLENQKRLDEFVRARNSTLFKRLFLFNRTGIYQQTLLGSLGLKLGILLNRI